MRTIRIAVSANILSQLYQAGIRLAVVPLYLSLMGVEAYGLVGVYLLLLSLIQLLDFGIGPTVSREFSRMVGGAVSVRAARQYLARNARIFWVIAVAFVIVMVLLAPQIAGDWLNPEALPVSETITSLRLMAIAAGLTFVGGLYRSALLGIEKQTTFAWLTALFATLRSVGVLAVLIWISPGSDAYFSFQLAISLLELAALYALVQLHVPPEGPKDDETISAQVQRPLLGFTGGIGLTTFLWFVMLQLDRFVLSRALPLKEFGYFTIAINAAWGVLFLFSPILQVLQPRFVVLAAAGRTAELRAQYFKLSYGVSALVICAAGVLAAFPRELVYAWTGNQAVADWSASVLPYYAIGNAAVGLCAFPYLLQFALGEIRLHVLGHIIQAVLYVPIVIWAGFRYGAQGTGIAWLTLNLAYLLFWVPLIHKQLLPGQHLRWLVGIALPPSAITAIAVLLSRTVPFSGERSLMFAWLLFIGLISLGVTLAASVTYRELARDILQWKRVN